MDVGVQEGESENSRADFLRLRWEEAHCEQYQKGPYGAARFRENVGRGAQRLQEGWTEIRLAVVFDTSDVV